MSVVALPRTARAHEAHGDRAREIPASPAIFAWVAFLIAWQLAIPLLPTLLVPTPAEVGEFMWDEIRGDTLAPQTVYEAFGLSLQRLTLGLAIAFAIGVPIGLLMGLSKKATWFGHDFVVVGLAMPSWSGR